MGEGDEGEKLSETGRRVCNEREQENQLAARRDQRLEQFGEKRHHDALFWSPQHGVLKKILELGRNNMSSN